MGHVRLVVAMKSRLVRWLLSHEPLVTWAAVIAVIVAVLW